MSYETYCNLVRAIERRIARLRTVGKWSELAEALKERALLQEEYEAIK